MPSTMARISRMKLSMTLFLAVLCSEQSGNRAAAEPVIQTIHLVDPARKNGTVSARLCMPDTTQTQQPWPLYIFGHGAVCEPEDYAYFCSVAVTVLVFRSASPLLDFNTDGLGKDAAFLARTLPQVAKEDASFPLHGIALGPVVLGGHSMGGGTAVLAAARAGQAVSGMALFAPGLYTLPSATPFLPNVSIPALVVSGSDDCGPNALPKQAQPTYDGLASKVKFLVVLRGANHCQWALPKERFFGVCKFKECGHLGADEQRRTGTELAQAFFAALADSSSNNWQAFEATLAAGERNGTWAYISAQSSTAGKAVHNDCPCQATVSARGEKESGSYLV